jgi:hypothetical protein
MSLLAITHPPNFNSIRLAQRGYGRLSLLMNFQKDNIVVDTETVEGVDISKSGVQYLGCSAPGSFRMVHRQYDTRRIYRLTIDQRIESAMYTICVVAAMK